MSVTSHPIPADRFAAALESLSVPLLHAKAAELRNSLLHLRLSNAQLQAFADDGDADCAEALRENDTVLERLRDRLDMLKLEVEKRGSRWIDWDEEEAVNGCRDTDGGVDTDTAATNGDTPETLHIPNVDRGLNARSFGRQGTGGTLSDEELVRRMRDQLGEADDEQGGLHL